MKSHLGTLLNILGLILSIEGFFMLTCIPFALYYQESTTIQFLYCGIFTFILGALLRFLFRKGTELKNKKYSFLFVVLIWVAISIFGTLPYLITNTFTNFTDAFFETVSGFATTGATLMSDVEAAPKSVLFWRSLTQWIGGMGIIMLVIAIVPYLGINSFSLYSAEMSGPAKDKLHPKMLKTAQILWYLYILITAIYTIALLLCGLGFFDAINHAFSCIATGGFSTKNSSVADFSISAHYVISFAVLFSSINFTLIYFFLKGNFKKVFKNEEFRFFGKIVLFSIAFTVIILKLTSDYGWEESFRHGLFQVASSISTTGLVATDYTSWNPALTLLVLLLMLCGGMAGSTAGGFKIVRIMILSKNVNQTLKEIIHSRAISQIKINNRILSEDITQNVIAFALVFFSTFVIGVVLLIIFNVPPIEALGGSAACLSGGGVGLGEIGGFGNYLSFSIPAKWVAIVLMLSGRLELMTVFILFSRVFWKK
ncbi:TrkH family potassium uptake protein [Bacteroidales bacterium OttesenSCG-928-C19]|nr:TrkH family potassium uptake protein [Bacteroidales bacterium OttesenSCG-928-C19]